MSARRAELKLTYNGKDISGPLSDWLIDFNYSDAAPGYLDDLQLTLADRERRWQSDWISMAGDKIKAEIITHNWFKHGETMKLPCGTFSVDAVDFAGPPDTVQIKALSLPVSASIRHEKRTRAWEKVKLSTLARDIAKRAGLKLFFSADDTTYDRIEQQDQSDMAFLMDACIKEGVAIKITGGKLVLFDEAKFEQQAPIMTINRGESNVSSYSFSWSTSGAAYRSCVVTYQHKKKKMTKTIQASYTPPGAPKTGPTLRIKEKIDSQAAGIRLAKKKLREKNKEVGKASLSMMGDVRLAAGATIQLKDFGRFDGKYIIVSAKHAVGSGGYRTDLEIRKVLGW
ncbi:phage late control D family protein [Paenibacillus sp. 481]|uniref:phage late control D family protein n=1 Tax=Paenibacillus sp. 481 TaxID=2835869 RepID=UPI001E5B15D1|nr:late control protein [Paenibacillus sp. 481]